MKEEDRKKIPHEFQHCMVCGEKKTIEIVEPAYWILCLNCRNKTLQSLLNLQPHTDVLECDGCKKFIKTTRVFEGGKWRDYCDACWIKYKEGQEAFTHEHYK